MIHFDMDNYPFRIDMKTEAIHNPIMTYILSGHLCKYNFHSRSLYMESWLDSYYEICLTHQREHIKGVDVYDSIFHSQ